VAERRFVVEGPQAVREALAAGGLLELYAVDPSDPLAVQAAAHGVEVVAVSQPVLEALAETVTPQGLVGVAPFLDTDLGTVLSSPPRLVAVLHEVADPGNAGTVIRTADAAGADAVVLSGSSVDPYNGKTVRATAGSLFLVNIQVEALDRTRLLSDVTRVLSDAHVNILSATVTTTRDRVAVSRFSFEMGDPKHMGHLLGQVRAVEGVYDAYRVTS
jgi:TrmH family RNA methyltransferase